MRVTASRLLVRWADPLWAVFAALSFVAMIQWHVWETVPFHFVWISLTLLWGYRLWPFAKTAIVLAAVCAVSFAILGHEVVAHGGEIAELSEVPLMAGVFVAGVWHARRRQLAVEQVHQAAERERDFVRDASHLLRTPITVARGHAELLAGEATGQARRDVDVIVSELTRLSRIADRLLLLASAEHPSFVGLAPVDTTVLLHETVERWAGAADRDWRCEVAADGMLAADEDRLVCALDALIDNALRATQPGDRIAVRARAEGGVAVLEVADSGTGIERDLLPHVFERFTRSSGGTGLGLPIVRAIAEAHDGTAEIVSAPGEGTTVRLRLPGFTPAVGEPCVTPA